MVNYKKYLHYAAKAAPYARTAYKYGKRAFRHVYKKFSRRGRKNSL